MEYPYELYNPCGKSLEELPTIFGFNNGGSFGWMEAVLIAEDGHCLGSHICSHEGFMLMDLGISKGTRPDRHENFREHYPDGYKMDFVSFDDVPNHTALNKAFKLNDLLTEAEKTKE